LAAIAVYPDGAERHRLQLTYRNGDGRVFTVYLAGRSRPEGFELIGRGSLRICIWRTDELSAVMVGEMSTNEMLRVASLTYADLNF
jgi:anti-sigma factor RsiW